MAEEKCKSIIEELEEKERKEFFSKKSSEKFEFLINEIQEINGEIRNWQCNEHYCDSDENSEWIEKIKFEQISFLRRIENLEEEVFNLGKKMEVIESMLKIDEIRKKENRLKKLEAEERTRLFFQKK